MKTNFLNPSFKGLIGLFNLTTKAKEKLLEIANGEGIPACVRVKVAGGGCGGLQNDIQFDEIQSDLDEAFQFDEVKVIIDPFSLDFLNGTTIDYVEDNISSGFKFLNPSLSSCGCGKSYGF